MWTIVASAPRWPAFAHPHDFFEKVHILGNLRLRRRFVHVNGWAWGVGAWGQIVSKTLLYFESKDSTPRPSVKFLA